MANPALNLQKRIDDTGIELRFGCLGDQFDTLFVRQCLLVDAFAPQRVVHIGHSHDASRQRNLFAGQTERVALAVPPLVVRRHDFAGHSQKIRRSEAAFDFL